MKPIVIYLDKHDDEIKLTKKEFEEYINKAYDQGYACGYAEGKKYYPWWGNGGITYTSTNVPRDITFNTSTGTPPLEPDTRITCSSDINSATTTTDSTSYNNDASEPIFNAMCEALNAIGD